MATLCSSLSNCAKLRARDVCLYLAKTSPAFSAQRNGIFLYFLDRLSNPAHLFNQQPKRRKPCPAFHSPSLPQPLTASWQSLWLSRSRCPNIVVHTCTSTQVDDMMEARHAGGTHYTRYGMNGLPPLGNSYSANLIGLNGGHQEYTTSHWLSGELKH